MIKDHSPLCVNIFLFFSLQTRRQAGGLDFTSYEEHKAVWLGQKSKVSPIISRIYRCVYLVITTAIESFPPVTFCAFFPFPLQYIVVSSKKILFYNNEQDREQANPFMTLDIE